MRIGRDTWLALLLVLATLLAYQPAWNGKPVWDDDDHMTRPEQSSLASLARIWTQPGATPQFYPLVNSIFWLEQKLWGYNTLGYHLVNILLHAASALLLVRILRRLAVPGAWLAAGIFALHPVHVESVAWISELKNTLSGVFSLSAALAFLCFHDARDNPGRSRPGVSYALSLTLFVLGLLCKTVIATLPGALLVLLWWSSGRLSWKRDVLPLVPFFVLGLIAGLFTAHLERVFVGAEGEAFNFSLLERFQIAGRAFWFYQSKLLFPANLSFVYPRWEPSQTALLQYLFPLAALALFTVLFLSTRKSAAPARRSAARALLAGFLVFAGTLFPALGFVNVFPFVYSFVADHFQYLASLGIIALFAAAAVRFAPAAPRLRLGLSAALLLLLGGLTWAQSHMFIDTETLWRTTAARNPQAWMAHSHLGLDLLSRGDVDEAILQFRKAVAIRPRFAEAHSNLGIALLRKGLVDEAISELEQAVAIEPGLAKSRNNLGNALLQKGRLDDAAAQLQVALSIQPNYAEAGCNLALVLLAKNLPQQAVAVLRNTIALSPAFPGAHFNLGNALLDMGQFEAAASEFSKALNLDPALVQARCNLGNALLQLGRPDQAITQFQTALAADPALAGARYNLALALLRKGRVPEAIEQLRLTLQTAPDFEPARTTLQQLLKQ